jgi:hypothetical protein
MLKISGLVHVQATGDALPESARDATAGVSTDPYGPERGAVKIRLASAGGRPEELRLFFTEHRPQNRKQHAVAARMDTEVSVELPSGEYTMQILARGFETIRGLVDVDPKHPFVVDAMLKPREKRPRTFEERLAKYRIDASKTQIGDLTVPPGRTQALNSATDRDRRSLTVLQTDSIAQIKEWIGSQDARFGHARPVFGALPDPKHLGRWRDGADLRALDPDEVKAVTSIAREYVHGNSRAVALYEPRLNEAIRRTVRDAMVNISVYFYRIVTVGAGATLEIGNGSAVFACDELRIHRTGSLQPVADVTIDIGTYREFQ